MKTIIKLETINCDVVSLSFTQLYNEIAPVTRVSTCLVPSSAIRKSNSPRTASSVEVS